MNISKEWNRIKKTETFKLAQELKHNKEVLIWATYFDLATFEYLVKRMLIQLALLIRHFQ